MTFTPNLHTVRHATWTDKQIRSYYISRAGRSSYSMALPFQPTILGDACPKQLHETKRHAGGKAFAYTEMGGTPAQTKAVEAMLDGNFPHEVMAGAVAYLRQRFPDCADVLHRCAWKGRKDTMATVAAEMGLAERVLYRMVDTSVVVISDYLRQLLNGVGKEVG